MPAAAPSPGLSRRQLLGAAGGLGLMLLSGCTDVPGSTDTTTEDNARCVDRDTLDPHRTVAGLPLIYEPSRRRSRFWFDPTFYAGLDDWTGRLERTLGARPTQLWTYGSWTNGGTSCTSWHNAGRAFDLARVRLDDRSFVSCRYDQWRDQTGAELTASQQAYWRLAASLHQRFAYVLTYLYNVEHHNHIHVDNSRSGSGPSTFRRTSRVQVQAVQAICTYLWSVPVELTGSWDAATRRASRTVLDRIGAGSDLEGGSAWSAFLTASADAGRR
jgi:hypothetical protein